MLTTVGPVPARWRAARVALALACGLLGPGLAGTGAASEISDRLDRMARQLVDGYHAKHPNATGEAVAILPFNCTEALAKQRVGAAVAELLTQRLVAGGAFRVVERDQLRKVLEEQSLGLTGVIETASAASVGRLVGAAYLVVGSVDRLGSHYELNARLLDATSADVVTSAAEEVPAEAFETEARPYLALVPDEEVIGIYLAGVRAGAGRTEASTQLASGAASLVTDGTPSAHYGGLGVGLRYAPAPWVMADLGVGFGGMTGVANVVPTYAGTTVPSAFNVRVRESTALVGSVNWVSRFARSFRVLAGAGCAIHSVAPDANAQTSAHLNSGATVSVVADQSWSGGPNYPAPFVRAGVEWKPQPRLGLSLLVNVEPVRHSVDVIARFSPDDHSAATAFTVARFDMPVVTADLAAALYF